MSRWFVALLLAHCCYDEESARRLFTGPGEGKGREEVESVSYNAERCRSAVWVEVEGRWIRIESESRHEAVDEMNAKVFFECLRL